MFKTHSCKQYVQETRGHLDQGYDAYTYLKVLERSNKRNTLEKTMLDNTRVFFPSKCKRIQLYQDMEDI